MAFGEFDLIKTYFDWANNAPDLLLGIGDDAAVIKISDEQCWVITTDTLNAGVHFPHNTTAADIACKAAAVNLSDLAAMGATPRFALLNLCVPDMQRDWLAEFSAQLKNDLQINAVLLIGGDTTRGPLSIALTLIGEAHPQHVLRRDAAQIGDVIAVTGTLGDARLGLELALQQTTVNDASHAQYLLQRLNRPTPRLAASNILRGCAHAAIDVSDGFAQDLQHILKRSGVGAVIDIEKLPLSHALRCQREEMLAWDYAINGGDDYELIITVPAARWRDVQNDLQNAGCSITAVGHIVQIDAVTESLLQWRFDGKTILWNSNGFQHF